MKKKAKLIKESLTTPSVDASELFVVCKEDLTDIGQMTEVYTSESEARPEANFQNSQAHKEGREANYTYYSLGEIFNELADLVY